MYAEKQFKDVGEAFDVLNDPKKRRMYDQGMDLEDMQNGGGHSHGHGGMGGIDPSVLFQMFGGGGGGRGGFRFG